MSTRYSVYIEKYAERHFIKSFKKKHKRAWDITIETLIRELQSLDVLLEKKVAEMITETGDFKICKVEFKIAGSNQSRHGSGNRCIIVLDKEGEIINVLLVYHKNHLGHGNETANWKKIIKENYPKYRETL